MTTREPGPSEVFTAGFTLSPRATAFFASKPAASMTLGFEVFVQLVIAAMSTEPWPICVSAGRYDVRVMSSAGVGLGRLLTISATFCGAPSRM